MAASSEVQRVRDVFLNSIRTLAEAIEAKDPYTAGHSKRVAEIAAQIASAMNLSAGEVSQTRLAAMLHDIGMIGVREAVYNKPRPLAPEEYEEVMRHTDIGRRILEPLFRGNKVLDLVAHHHERFDGTGRPSGLCGIKIPLGARIIALADAVDAMDSSRPYRPRLSHGQIVSELRKGSGTQFDPQVVDAFFKTEHSKMLQAEEEAALDLAMDAAALEPARDAASGPATGEAAQPFVTHGAPLSLPAYSRRQVLDSVMAARDFKALPFVTAEVLNLTSRPDSDIDTLTQTILRDPSLVAKVLKLANTSFYASKGRVQTVERAVVNIGYSGVRELVMGVAVANLFQTSQRHEALDRVALWRHQLAVAAIARAIAGKAGSVTYEGAFAAGLLHDLGITILDDLFPSEYAQCISYAAAKGIPLVEAEHAFFGIEHTTVAQEVATSWNIGRQFRAPMGLHHEPWARILELPVEDAVMVSLVKLADLLSRAISEGSDCDQTLEEVPRAASRRLAVDADAVARILSDLPSVLMELEAIFLLHGEGSSNALARREPPSQLAGKSALFVEPSDKPLDLVKLYMDGLGLKTQGASSVREGAQVQPPDLVVIRGHDDAALTANLKELAELTAGRTSSPVRVLVLGNGTADSKAPSLYPPELTAVIGEPYSKPLIDRSLLAFFPTPEPGA